MLGKYYRIYKTSIQNNISYEAQYRADMWVNLGINILWLVMLFVFIEVLYGHTAAIAGWTRGEMYQLATYWVLLSDLSAIFFQNIDAIPDIVTDGRLDIYITKPASALFLLTVNFRIKSIYHLMADLMFAGWVVYNFNTTPTLWHAALGIVLLLFGLMVTYSIRLIINTLSFWFLRIDNVNDLFYSALSLSEYPIDIFPKTIRVILLTIIPIGLTAYVPAATAIGRWPWYMVLYAIGFNIMLFLLALKFWNFAVKRYSSASS